MTNRREVLQGGIALTSLPIVANVAWVAAGASSGTNASARALYRVVFDDRFAAARAFGAEARRLGAAVHGIDGDITDFWYHNLDLQWRRETLAIAGMTLHGPLFCLERLAWDVGMRVVYRAEHVSARGGPSTYLIQAPQGFLPLASAQHARENDWARCAARLVASCPLDTRAYPTATGVDAVSTEDNDRLISWVIAPRARGQAA
jgi:hypothetical protein